MRTVPPSPARPVLRAASMDELPGLAELCLRSKAVWGYDAAFLAACRAELGFGPDDLSRTDIAVAARDALPLGVVQLRVAGRISSSCSSIRPRSGRAPVDSC